MSAQRLWRWPAMGGPPIGFDLVQLRALADARGVPWDRETIGFIQVMEDEAAAVWTADWKRKHPDKG